jgi:hypothetical protein
MEVLKVIGFIVGAIVLIEVFAPLGGYVVENADEWWKLLTSRKHRQLRKLQRELEDAQAAYYGRWLEAVNK